MLSVVFDGQMRVEPDYPRPRRGEGESLIRVTLAGICNTDLEIAAGYMGFRGVPGHEFVGVVQESDDPSLHGQRVVGEINCGCGRCPDCFAGLERHCPQRSVLGILGRDGVFAEYTVLPDRNLHLVPSELEDVAAVFVEPVAAAFEILEQVHLLPTSRVIVLGDGKLGLLIAQVLAMAGCELVLLGHHLPKLEIARGLGIDARLSEQAPSARADVVVECTGSARGLAQAISLVRPRGTLVLKTTVTDKLELDLAPLVIDEITVVGSRCGPFAPALRALARGEIQVGPFVTEQHDLADAARAFDLARQPEALKVLLRP
ncbi:MAG: alcohol dehydrogenase [Chloroflexota bacterium]|nr:MAG: alcohol dehydrogenase [Chloroflexota bacterium]